MIKFRALMIAIAILIVFIVVLIARLHRDTEDRIKDNPATTTPDGEVRAVSVEDYVKLNISDLSAKADAPEVLGGKFYVTNIETHNGAGMVYYEDGHNAYIADFTYSVGENGFITINSFTVRP